MTSDTPSTGARIITVSQERLAAAYALACGPVVGNAYGLNRLMYSPEHPNLNDSKVAIIAVMLIPFLAWGWFVLHRAVARVEIDDAYISIVSTLRTRRSVALRDIVSETIPLGWGGHRFLVIETAAGAKLKIPDYSFSQDQLADLRDDIARRARAATGRDIPTQTPPETDNLMVCFFVVLLPVMAVIAIELTRFVSWIMH
jgi:hypothetical protein